MNTTGLVFTILGVLVGLAAVIWAAAQYRFSRRRTVRISRTRTLLVRKGPGASNIEVRLREHDVPIAEPYTVTMKLTAQRPNDVAVEAFGGRPLRIDFGAPVVSLIEVDGHPDALKIAAEWREEFAFDRLIELPFVNFIELPPALLSVAEPWTVTALCDGKPDPTIAGHLANVDFATNVGAQQQRLRKLRRAALAIFLAGIAGSIIAGLATQNPAVGGPFFIFGTMIAVVMVGLTVGRFEYIEEF